MTSLRPSRWPEGSTARVAHALGLWLAFVVVCWITRLAPPLGGVTYALAAIALFVGTYGYLMIRVGRLRAADLGLTLAGWRGEVLLGLAMVLAISAALLAWIGVIHGAGEIVATLRAIAGISPVARLPLLAVGVMAAAAEDTLFRGYLQPALMARWGSAAGLVLTAALFQVHHYVDWPSVERVGALAITGLGFGIPRWRDRPLVASYVAHIGMWTLWGYN